MSRWIEQFEAHPFQTTWLNLKAIVDSLKVDDETVVTSVKELARLRKAVAYIDGMISSIDPELVPMNTWDNFNSQATACCQQMQNFISNRNIEHLQGANQHVDNLMTYVRPYMVIEGKTGKVLQDSVKQYAKTIDEYVNSFRDASSKLINEIRQLNQEGNKSFDELKSTKEAIDLFSSELFEGNENQEGIQTRIKKLVDDFENKRTSLTNFYNESLIGNENDLSTKKIIFQAKEIILKTKEDIEDILNEVNTEINELKQFHTIIFGKADAFGEFSGGLKDELDTHMQNLKSFEASQVLRYEALNTEIESLLPGATSAGLATAYKEMKESFKDPIKYAGYVFYGSIGLLIFVSVISTISQIGGEQWINFVQIGSWDEVLRGLVNKLPFYAPILWLAYYASTRRSESQRLQQEYAHKEALAKSYHSYKKQLEELKVESEDLQKELIKKAIDAIAYNASQTLDGKHGDKMPYLDAFEKVLNKSTDKLLDAVKTLKPEN